MADSMSSGDFDVRSNLGPLIDDLKKISPKLATDTRRALRDTGAAIIQAQQAILESEPVGGVVSSTTYALWRKGQRGGYQRGPRARELGGARIVSVQSAASARGYHTGLREQAAANLVTQVRTPRTGRGAAVRVASKRPSWANKALNAKKWRHPVFGDARSRVEQAGNQYFQRGVALGIVEARAALQAVVQNAADLVKSHPLD